ncbi:MAG: transcription antitermination factor NusB [Oscillospiraceae bacterium]|nr:transcription antitermination factor NusB [Oscillospiraceae bacterium]
MTRTVAREIAVHFAYELGFTQLSAVELLEDQLTRKNFEILAKDEELYQEFPEEEQLAYIRRVVVGVGEHGYELDQYIEKYAIGWRFERIPKVAAAIMRVAMFEVLYMQEIPNGAAINSAVELAKKYEDEKVVAFLNGLLGAFVRGEAANG